MDKDLSFKAQIRLRNDGKHKGSRHFVSVDKKITKQIRQLTKDQPRKGRGSIGVKVTIGFYSRETSIFPDKKSDTYLLPLKKEVRQELKVGDGDEILVNLEIIK